MSDRTTSPRNRRLGVLHAQAEADSELVALQTLLREIVQRVVEAHAAGTRAHNELVTANRIVSQSELTEREQQMAGAA